VSIAGHEPLVWVGYEPKAGDLLSGPDGRKVLVGHVNELGGVCNDCTDYPWTFHAGLDEGWTFVRNVLEGME
jgi:hypothetical protein